MNLFLNIFLEITWRLEAFDNFSKLFLLIL